jgi:hypothetical protein
VPGVEKPGDIRMWGKQNCGRLNATINCGGNPHYVCNTTYVPSDPKCTLMEPTISGYSVSSTNVISNGNFSISIFSTCPNGLSGKCLIECRVINPNENYIEIDSWSNDASTTLPNVTCNMIGNYVVDYCIVYTDFSISGGWGAKDDTNTTVTCTPTPEFVSPTYSYNYDDSGGSVVSGTKVNVYVKWNDTSGLSTAIFRHNASGCWTSSTTTSLLGNSAWYNTSYTTSSGDVGRKICWNQWANDIFNNWNNTMPNKIHCFNIFEIPDTASPTYSYDNDTSGGSMNEGEPVIASTLWSDNKGLSSANTIHNETGNWISASTSLSGTSQWYNYTINTNGYKGKTICWYQNATDTSSNANNTMKNKIHCFNIITSTTTTTGTTIESVFESLRRSISASSEEFSINFLTLAFQFLGIIILIIILILVVQQIIQSHG